MKIMASLVDLTCQSCGYRLTAEDLTVLGKAKSKVATCPKCGKVVRAPDTAEADKENVAVSQRIELKTVGSKMTFAVPWKNGAIAVFIGGALWLIPLL